MAKRKFTVRTDRINKVASTGISLVKELRPKDQDALYFGTEPNYAENQNTSVIDALNWYNSETYKGLLNGHRSSNGTCAITN